MTGGKQTLMKGVKNVKGAIDAGVGMYKTINDGVETASKILNLGERVKDESLINSLRFLPTIGGGSPLPASFKFAKISKALTVIPKIGAVVGAANFVMGLFGKEEEPKPMIFDINLKGNGKIEFTQDQFPGSIANPGSILPTNPAPPTQYNNIMGIFNLLTTPVIDYRSSGSFRFYKLSKDIEYVINKSAGFKDSPGLAGAIVVEFDDTQVPPVWINNLVIIDRNVTLNKESPRRYRSDFVPLACLKDLQVILTLI